MATLTTHVLDTSRGRAAAAVVIELHVLRENLREQLHMVTTNADGRINAALAVEPGVYELTFHAGDYLRGAGHSLPDPPFLDQIVIRFGIAEPGAHYHVPLLLSPYGYSTYRGS